MISPDQLFNSPVPGQSLTESPDNASPWEMPPKFSSPGPALDHFYQVCTGKKFQRAFHQLISEDKQFFVDRLACQMLMEGYMAGLFTPDVMMLILEPLMCLLVWLASQMDLPVSFSTDSGAEDRTGFEAIMALVDGGAGLVGFEEAAQQTEQEAEGPDMGTQGTPAPQPEGIPGAAPAMQSPLMGGM